MFYSTPLQWDCVTNYTILCSDCDSQTYFTDEDILAYAPGGHIQYVPRIMPPFRSFLWFGTD